jgi:hypothetical protein
MYVQYYIDKRQKTYDMYIQYYIDKRHLIYQSKHFATLDDFFGIFKLLFG